MYNIRTQNSLERSLCFNQAQTEIKVVNLNPNLGSRPCYGCGFVFSASRDIHLHRGQPSM